MARAKDADKAPHVQVECQKRRQGVSQAHNPTNSLGLQAIWISSNLQS